jgi:hypothetical protein
VNIFHFFQISGISREKFPIPHLAKFRRAQNPTVPRGNPAPPKALVCGKDGQRITKFHSNTTSLQAGNIREEKVDFYTKD